ADARFLSLPRSISSRSLAFRGSIRSAEFEVHASAGLSSERAKKEVETKRVRVIRVIRGSGGRFERVSARPHRSGKRSAVGQQGSGSLGSRASRRFRPPSSRAIAGV